jgi:hypothetical protein
MRTRKEGGIGVWGITANGVMGALEWRDLQGVKHGGIQLERWCIEA